MTTLKNVIEKLSDFEEDQTIYAAGITGESAAVVDYETDDGEPPASADGMRYLLEVSIARDAIRVWSEWRDGQMPTLDQKLEAVVFQAQNDAFLPIAD